MLTFNLVTISNGGKRVAGAANRGAELRDLTGSGLNSMGAGSLQLQMLPYPSTLLQKIFLRRFSSVSAQWHSASAGRTSTVTTHQPNFPSQAWLLEQRLTFRGGELHLSLEQDRVTPRRQGCRFRMLLSINLT